MGRSRVCRPLRSLWPLKCRVSDSGSSHAGIFHPVPSRHRSLPSHRRYSCPPHPLIVILCPCTLQHPHDTLNGVHFLAKAVAQQRQGIQGALTFQQHDIDGLTDAHHIFPQGYRGDFVGHTISKFAPFDGRVVTDALECMAILETENAELKGQDREIGTRCPPARARDPQTARFQ
ncbi:hypothetical protein EW146_g9210 [Bondarzewia mesenterica]|uniref:Uncharacterized protein n=1 Tax=Bondarzewia mesenterica TaxID=1095465 RepID=A0A4S4L8E8_9AGAM|nr:hypothetical protein EW146_g9210 [Bondarzewia mesenterica]